MPYQGLATQRLKDILNSYFRGDPTSIPATVYAGLCTADPGLGPIPTDEVSGSGTAYQRLLIPITSWNVASDDPGHLGGVIMTNLEDFIFPVATTTWGQVSHYFLATGSALGTGDTIAAGKLTTVRQVQIDDAVRFPIGELKISIYPSEYT